MMGMKGVWRKDDTFHIKRIHMRQQLKKKDKNKIILHRTKQEWQCFQQCLAITLFDAKVWYQDKDLQFQQMEDPHINSLIQIWWRKGRYQLNHSMASQLSIPVTTQCSAKHGFQSCKSPQVTILLLIVFLCLMFLIIIWFWE